MERYGSCVEGEEAAGTTNETLTYPAAPLGTDVGFAANCNAVTPTYNSGGNVSQKLESLETALDKVQGSLDDHTKRIEHLESDVGYMLKITENSLLVGQLAYSYQYKLGEYVGLSAGMLTRTHESIRSLCTSKRGDLKKFGQIENYFLRRNCPYIAYSEDIDTLINIVREIGLNRPAAKTDAMAHTDSAGMTKIIYNLRKEGRLSDNQVGQAIEVLAAVEELMKRLPAQGLLYSG
jgi:hypothetical protein